MSSAIARALERVVHDPGIRHLTGLILAGGDRVLEQQYTMAWFPGDDLFAACRPRGLPIGNLTSQFWANCYLHALDLFVVRELGCRAYVRYVDDLALFDDSRSRLREWRGRIDERLARLRLTAHERSAQVEPVRHGMPWLGFVIFPDRRRLKGRRLRHGVRRLDARFDDWCAGRITFAEFDASARAWINHVRHADTLGLRERVLARYVWGPQGPKNRERGA